MEAHNQDQSLTIADIVAICPEVGRAIQSAKKRRGSYENEMEYVRVKSRIKRLVGWYAHKDADERLRTSGAYLTVIQALSQRLGM